MANTLDSCVSIIAQICGNLGNVVPFLGLFTKKRIKLTGHNDV